MSFEIERKFLVTGDFKSQAYSSSRIRQGYISTVGKATVRVRIRDDKGYLTIKGRSNEAGISRYEFETEVPLQDASEVLRVTLPFRIANSALQHYFSPSTLPSIHYSYTPPFHFRSLLSSILFLGLGLG